MRKIIFFAALAGLFLVFSFPAHAQQPEKIPRVVYLTAGSPSTSPARREAFRQGLRELGYVEGKNIVIEYRYAEGKQDRLPALAAELVRLKVDVIVAVGSREIRAVKDATLTIPIVMVRGGDPVGSGFVASLARPGGSITGLANLRPELSGKRLELLKEIIPKLSRVAVMASSLSQDYAQTLKEIEVAAVGFGVRLQSLDIVSPNDFATAFQDVTKARSEALLFRVPGIFLSPRGREIVSLAFQRLSPRVRSLLALC